MIKDIKYSGYTARPSDYECQDGELSMSLNLLNEDGGIKTLGQPKAELTIVSGHELLLIHSVPSQENLILLTGNKQGQFGLSWIKREDGLESTEDASAIELKSSLKGLRDISIVGNTLAVATSGGIYYILWKDNNYKFLGDKPPFLPISFGAYKVGILDDSTSTTYTDVPHATYIQYAGNYSGSNRPHASWTKDDDAFWAQNSMESLGILLSKIADKVTTNGYTYQPYFIRYAFKLYDGSYSWHSAPVLMLTSTHRPIIKISCEAADGEHSMKVTCNLEVPYFATVYKIYGTLDLLKEWSDIITGVDIFFSSPLYTYKQEDSGRPIKRKDIFSNLYRGGGHRGRNNTVTTSTDSNTSSTEETKAFVGHYANGINGEYIDHFVSLDDSNMDDYVCSLKKSETFNDKVQHEYLFYKVSSLNLEDLNTMSAKEILPLTQADLTNINTLEYLPDEYNSHATVLADALYSYNQRLIMSDISLIPPKPFPMLTMASTAVVTSDSATSEVEKIRVFTRINGTKCVSEFTHSAPQLPTDLSFYPYNKSFPRFIYHPDPSAYKMEITAPDGKFYSLPLKQHPHLNGAYWFGGLAENPSDVYDDVDNTTKTSERVGSKIYVSEINNPFIFPVENIVTIGCGRIFDICSAAKALSQGQFGQFPLYAFTDNGVWALEISSTGTILAKQPITRDVCINNPGAITQIDSAVLFPTDRGIMLISGSSTICISEPINDNATFDISKPINDNATFNISKMPHISDLHSNLGHSSTGDTCLPVVSFRKFLLGCRMVYDYAQQRIIVYNKAYTYAYVYSLKTKLWGMMYSNLSYNVNSYPEAIAVTGDGKMVNCSESDDQPVKGLLVTRPIKLETNDVLKTMDTVIQRGNFRKGHVKSALYGSRDLYNWFLIWSSKDHYLRGFRGTPYKYFRIACVTELAEDEVISGASLQFTPRHTNQPR